MAKVFLLAQLALLAPILAFAQQPKFEVADVHVSTMPTSFSQSFGGILRDGKYANRDATMLSLISAAYGVPEEDIAGGPGWVGNDLFDVIAKVPEGTTTATVSLMLQSLLADRFGLVVRQDTRPMPRYILSIGKGSRMKPAGGSGGPGCQPQQQAPGNPADPASFPNNKVSCHNLTSAEIAENLRQMAGGYLDHDVMDETKLEGTWDFDLEWTGRGALAAKGPDGISVFDAVDKQLGLKLELKDVPVSALTIEKVNRRPTDNPPGISSALALSAARFEAASIKPADPNGNPFTGLRYTGGSQMRAGGTLRSLISMSMQVMPNVANDMIVGLPPSADKQLWDITAKTPSSGDGAPNMSHGQLVPPPLSVGLEMLRGLLVDQFELKTHTENREITVYALSLAGGKPKMTQADDSERTGCNPDPTAPKPAANVTIMLRCKNTSMGELAENVQGMAGAYIDHPIVNATGLQGGWDFLLGWTPRGALQGAQASSSNPSSGAVPTASDPGGLSIFDALGSELGLKLVKEKRSIQVIVVDHVRETPIG